MLKKLLIAALVIAVIAVILNDAWQYSEAQRNLRDTTYDLTMWAARNGGDLSRDQAAAKVAALATQDGVTVYQYDQSEQGVRVWTQSTVPNTIVVGTVVNLTDGMPIAEATKTPFVIRDYREAGMQ
jgi:hypothetical protein